MNECPYNWATPSAIKIVSTNDPIILGIFLHQIHHPRDGSQIVRLDLTRRPDGTSDFEYIHLYQVAYEEWGCSASKMSQAIKMLQDLPASPTSIFRRPPSTSLPDTLLPHIGPYSKACWLDLESSTLWLLFSANSGTYSICSTTSVSQAAPQHPEAGAECFSQPCGSAARSTEYNYLRK